MRESFFYGRDFIGDADLQAQLDHWLVTTANPRIHGTTREVPQLRFERDEKALLKPLAAHPYRPPIAAHPSAPHAATALVARTPSGAADPPRLAVERRDLRSYDQLLGVQP